jgi:hypothetical protein
MTATHQAGGVGVGAECVGLTGGLRADPLDTCRPVLHALPSKLLVLETGAASSILTVVGAHTKVASASAISGASCAGAPALKPLCCLSEHGIGLPCSVGAVPGLFTGGEVLCGAADGPGALLLVEGHGVLLLNWLNVC